MLTAAEIEIVQDLVKILEPLEAVTKEISGEKYVTSSIIIPMINCLCATLQRYNPRTSIGVKIINLILDDIKKRFGCVEQITLLAVSTVMDPRFKKIHFNNSLAYSQTITKIKQMLTKIPTSVQRTTSNESSLPETNQTFFLWNLHEKLVQDQPQEDYDFMSDDLRNYLLQPVLDLKQCNPIHYWIEHANTRFSNISELAKKYLCVVATSVPSERLFSLASNILREKRNKLSGDRLHKLLFLKSLDFEN